MSQSTAQSTIACIVNADGRNVNLLRLIERLAVVCRAHGTQADTHIIERGSELMPTARSVAKNGYSTIVAAGGDETVSAVAAAVVGTEASLGVLPIGTLNRFAKDAGLPLDPNEAVDTIFHGEPKLVDVGEVNGRIFINNSNVGFYPAIAQEHGGWRRRRASKWIAFAHTTCSVLRRCPSFHTDLSDDGAPDASDGTPFIFVGNNPYATSGLRIGERQRLESGRLWLCRAPPAGRWALIRSAARAAMGRPSLGELRVLEAEELWVHSQQRRYLRVANDGEVFSTTAPLHYRIRPKALRVIVPADKGRRH